MEALTGHNKSFNISYDRLGEVFNRSRTTAFNRIEKYVKLGLLTKKRNTDLYLKNVSYKVFRALLHSMEIRAGKYFYTNGRILINKPNYYAFKSSTL